MPVRLDSDLPQAYLRLLEGSHAHTVTAELGALARVLSASRPGGVFLCCGDGGGPMAAWILDGMDLSSRLVVVIDEAGEAEPHRDAVGDALGDDLRVTVHVQDAIAFLDDVRDHRFDLIADASAEPPAERVCLALARLAPAGLLLTRCPLETLEASMHAEPTQRAHADPAAFAAARLPETLDATLLARRPQRSGGKRRGGRRARAGVTPLFSSKARKDADR